jgi:hypothetical protein
LLVSSCRLRLSVALFWFLLLWLSLFFTACSLKSPFSIFNVAILDLSHGSCNVPSQPCQTVLWTFPLRYPSCGLPFFGSLIMRFQRRQERSSWNALRICLRAGRLRP